MIIRQEINILTSLLSAATAVGVNSNELVSLDTTKYSGTVTYYFEFITYASVSIQYHVSLRRDGTTTDDADVTLTNGTTPTLYTQVFTPPAGATDYHARLSNATGATKNLKSAKIIVIQDTSTSGLYATETQIEIGNAQAGITSATGVALTNPKYWLYTSANWNGTLTAFFEATVNSVSSKVTVTAQLQVADGTGNGFVGFANVTNGVITSAAGTAIRVRSTSFTLTAGRNYRIVVSTNNSKSSVSVHNAKIIIDQVDGYVDSNITSSTFFGGTGAVGEGSQAVGQSFKINGTSTITGVRLQLAKTGAPTDIINVDITSSLGGVSLANATLSGSSLTLSAAYYTATFSSPISLTGGTTYYIQLTRSGVRDTTNSYVWYQTNDQNIYPDGTNHSQDSTVWSNINSGDFSFLLVGQVGVTKFEAQYLVANTLFAAGTALQVFPAKWDSTVWSGVSNVYKLAVDAANASTSVVALLTSNGVTTIGTVTSPNNQGISAALTMPADQNLDTKATTNNSDVYGVRILVLVSPIPTIPNKQYSVKQAVKRSSFY